MAVFIQPAKLGLRYGMALLGGASVPAGCFCIVLGDAFVVMVAEGNPKLYFRIGYGLESKNLWV